MENLNLIGANIERKGIRKTWDELGKIYLLVHDSIFVGDGHGYLYNYRKMVGRSKNTDNNSRPITILITDELINLNHTHQSPEIAEGEQDSHNCDNSVTPCGTWIVGKSSVEESSSRMQSESTYEPDEDGLRKNEHTFHFLMNSAEDYKMIIIPQAEKNNLYQKSSTKVALVDDKHNSKIVKNHDEINLVPFRNDFTSRIRGLFDMGLLETKRVAFIGVGSVGAAVAAELTRSGVSDFLLIDPDSLEVHNICRHICGLSQIGRPKVEAVKDLIIDINPNANVKVVQKPFRIIDEDICDEITSCSLVIASTDKDLPKREVNYLCVKHEIPALYAGTYERAFGGEVIRYIPKVTACYNCVLGLKRKLEDEFPAGALFIDYSSVTDPSEINIMPGLSIDIGFINFITAKTGLMMLLNKWMMNGQDPDEPAEIIFWGNCRDWIFKGPFDYVPGKFDIPPGSCDVCDPSYFEQELGLSSAEIHERIKSNKTIKNAIEMLDK